MEKASSQTFSLGTVVVALTGGVIVGMSLMQLSSTLSGMDHQLAITESDVESHPVQQQSEPMLAVQPAWPNVVDRHRDTTHANRTSATTKHLPDTATVDDRSRVLRLLRAHKSPGTLADGYQQWYGDGRESPEPNLKIQQWNRYG